MKDPVVIGQYDALQEKKEFEKQKEVIEDGKRQETKGQVLKEA